MGWKEAVLVEEETREEVEAKREKRSFYRPESLRKAPEAKPSQIQQEDNSIKTQLSSSLQHLKAWNSDLIMRIKGPVHPNPPRPGGSITGCLR